MNDQAQRIEDEDWPKQTWDILPATPEALLDALRVERAPFLVQRRAIADFMRLPVARAMPSALRAELVALGLVDE